FTRYEDETLAEADAQLGEWKYPTSAWIPGVTVRHQARLTIPRGAATPRSYWLTARVWHEDEEVHVEETTLEESGTGTVVLCGLPLLSRGAPPDAPTPAAYSSAGGRSSRATISRRRLPPAAPSGWRSGGGQRPLCRSS